MSRVRGVTGHSRVAIEHGWEVACTPAGAVADPRGLDGLRWVPATVPGTAAGALRAAGQWSWDERRDFDAEDWWWRVPLGGELNAGFVLGLDGVATLWDAWLDGKHVATGDNMWLARRIEIRHPARELVIRCRSLDAELAKKRPRPRWRVPMLEQQQLRWMRTSLLGRTPGWSPPCAAVGPWRPVWLEAGGDLVVEDVHVDAHIEVDEGIVDCSITIAELESAVLVITRGDQRIEEELLQEDDTWACSASVPRPARWWPHTHGEPARYALAIEAKRAGKTHTIDLGHTGFRTLQIEQSDGRDYGVRINGVMVFCRGACWTPLDVVTLQASQDHVAAAVAQMRDAGMNMVRIGGTMVYESDALYDALDEQGVLLWQDLMFANMDYPDDPTFVGGVEAEVTAQLGRLQARPSLAIVCGNSEGEQQAAMWGAPRERWQPALFDKLGELVRAQIPRIPYVPSSTHGGAFPHASNAGPASYYGVGAYLRPLDDARRAEVRFASECLAFANIPAPSGLPGGAALRVHSPMWKVRAPRDLGAGWDFDDVRDHYLERVFGLDPVALRVADHERYLALGRAVTGEVMAQTFGEWRRARSPTRGGLIWFLRDLWPGAGWGVVDANGAPKPCWYPLRRALAPLAVAISDEGTNGLVIHVVNDGNQVINGKLELVLWRAGDVEVGRGAVDVIVPAHGAREIAATSLFDAFLDLSFAYRFGPPVAQVVHARLVGDFVSPDAFWFPAGLSATRDIDVGLAAKQTGEFLTVSAKRFAQYVAIDLPGWQPADDHFHLAPGQSRTIALRRTAAAIGRGTVTALNSEVGGRIEVAP